MERERASQVTLSQPAREVGDKGPGQGVRLSFHLSSLVAPPGHPQPQPTARLHHLQR